MLIPALLLVAATKAAAAEPARLEAAPAASARASVHLLLLGSPDDPTAPLTVSLLKHGRELALAQAQGRLTPVSASEYLVPMYMGRPLERVSAGVLTRVLAEPDKARAFVEARSGANYSPLQNLLGAVSGRGRAKGSFDLLLERAHQDPAVDALFDGRMGGLELDGMKAGPDGLRLEDTALERLGGGRDGVVQIHARIAGAVLKTIVYGKHEGPELGAAKLERGVIASQDESTGRLLADVGAGPRILGRSDQLDYPVIVKERVYGEDLEDIIERRAFGRVELSLVLEMVDRVARTRHLVRDLRTPNIRIGWTYLDPRRRAYFVDGIYPEPKPDMSHEELTSFMVNELTDPYIHHGQERPGRPLAVIFEEALVRSGAAPLWKRVKFHLRQRFARGRR